MSTATYEDYRTLGIDITVLPDLSENETLATNFDCLAQDLINGWTQPTGIADGTPEGQQWGVDIASYLNQGLTQQQLFALKVALEVQAERDDRVDKAVVALTFDNNVLTIKATVYTGDGPFPFSVKVTVNTVGDLYVEQFV
jgi:hypothetical protein